MTWPYTPAMPGTSWPMRSDLSVSCTPRSSSHVLWPCRRTALAVLVVDGDAPNSLTARRFELVTCCGGGPRRQQPPRQQLGHVGEDGHGEARVGCACRESHPRL